MNVTHPLAFAGTMNNVFFIGVNKSTARYILSYLWQRPVMTGNNEHVCYVGISEKVYRCMCADRYGIHHNTALCTQTFPGNNTCQNVYKNFFAGLKQKDKKLYSNVFLLNKIIFSPRYLAF